LAPGPAGCAPTTTGNSTSAASRGSPRKPARSGERRICTAICGIVVEVDGDEVLKVRGDPDHPLSHGYTCPKGRALPQLHHHPDRIERSLLRIDGRLEPVSWEACLDDLGDRLRAIIDEHGPASVGVYFGSGLGMDAAGYRMMGSLFDAIGTPAKFSPLTIDGTAKTLVAHLVGGFPGFTSHIDYERASLVLYIGVTPVVSHGHNIGLSDPVSAIRSLRSHAEVWVLDPRRPPEIVFGPGPRSRPETQAFLGEWPCAALPDEIRAGNIRAFLNLGGSILASFPDRNALEPALRSLDLLVSTDVIANPTTELSTHVLPTKGQLERADIALWDFLTPTVSAQHTHPVVGPVGDRRSAWWVLAEIGRRLGHDLADPNATDKTAGRGHGRQPLHLRRGESDRVRRAPAGAARPVGGALPRPVRRLAAGGWRPRSSSSNWPPCGLRRRWCSSPAGRPRS
jgi:anaerobic selenocysteine-containing dehydrogenase